MNYIVPKITEQIICRAGPVWKFQYRCAGLSSRQSAACPLVQTREPAAGIIVIDISAVLDRARAINNLSGLIEYERQLGQVAEIAIWMRQHHERNLRFGKPDFGCRSHRTLVVIGVGHASVFASAFAWYRCGASPPAIGSVERR